MQKKIFFISKLKQKNSFTLTINSARKRGITIFQNAKTFIENFLHL